MARRVARMSSAMIASSSTTRISVCTVLPSSARVGGDSHGPASSGIRRNSGLRTQLARERMDELEPKGLRMGGIDVRRQTRAIVGDDQLDGAPFHRGKRHVDGGRLPALTKRVLEGIGNELVD